MASESAPIRPRGRPPAAPRPEPTPIREEHAPPDEPVVLAPWSLEAERGVLGSILIDDRVLPAIEGLIGPESFYRQSHATIYRAMLALSRAGTPIDLTTLGEELRRTKRAEETGGSAYLAGLMSSVPTALNAEHYARIVAMKALARRAITDAGRISAMGYEESNDPDELLARLRATVDGIVESWAAGVNDVQAPALPDIPPPPEADPFLVTNLIRPGTTVMLAGPPGAAKSWAARQLALACGAGLEWFLERYAISRPLSVLVVDEDNGPDEEWRRDERLCTHLGLQRAQLATVRRTSLAGVRLDEPAWQHWLRTQIRRHAFDLVVLDPISEMHGGKELREDPAFAAVLRFLKRLRVDFPATTVIAVHHTRKLPASERSAHRGLEDVRGQWGQTPDVVVMISPLGERRVKWEVHKRVPHSSLILEQIAEGQPGEGGLRLVADETVMRDRAAQTDDKILNAIEAGARTAEEIRIGTGLSKPGVYKALRRLADTGLITKRAPFELIDDPTEDPL